MNVDLAEINLVVNKLNFRSEELTSKSVKRAESSIRDLTPIMNPINQSAEKFTIVFVQQRTRMQIVQKIFRIAPEGIRFPVGGSSKDQC
ncbi:hypothetical protein CDAR_295861 [Caerostris darwini]|uniref:Uncharacterized protein n=1 Tax=Caerostris darwini TaxID=1538125 RepID=A0AAV4UTW7_9ARAC|nr:hypothetical protein CDAR_295861 [Caerostris darwini]